MQLDMRVLELVSSKLCHDLISPVSAINNGVELIEDIGGSVVDEAMSLIGSSATQAARRLKLFRITYGRAGSEEGLAFRDARLIGDQYFEGTKSKLTWEEFAVVPVVFERKGFLKVILNLLVLSEEVLAYGGTVAIKSLPNDGGVTFEILGRNAQINPTIDLALKGQTVIDELTPRSIQAYITGRYVEFFGFSITYDQSINDRLFLTLGVSKLTDPI